MMKTATVADLRNKFATVSKWINAGEAVVITKRGLAFAMLTPTGQLESIPAIDWRHRLRKRFPNGPVKGDSQTVLDYDRGDT